METSFLWNSAKTVPINKLFLLDSCRNNVIVKNIVQNRKKGDLPLYTLKGYLDHFFLLLSCVLEMIDLHLRDTSGNNKHHKKYSKTIQEDKFQKNKVCLEEKYCTCMVNMYIIPVRIWANNLMNVNL